MSIEHPIFDILNKEELLGMFIWIFGVSENVPSKFRVSLAESGPGKPPLRLFSQKVEKEFSSKFSYATSWDVFDEQNKFLVSNPTTEVGGMSLI